MFPFKKKIIIFKNVAYRAQNTSRYSDIYNLLISILEYIFIQSLPKYKNENYSWVMFASMIKQYVMSWLWNNSLGLFREC